MRYRLQLAIFSVVVVLSCWDCGYTTLSGLSSSELGSTVPVAIPIVDIVVETNNRRKANGLSLLVENSKLNAVADYKMMDMFVRQYFGHYGPGQTSGIGELLIRVDYRYISAGENLAYGNIKNAKKLIKLWMASPGHRANILNSAYREIGVATGYDVFQGRRTIIAVQIFGTSRL